MLYLDQNLLTGSIPLLWNPSFFRRLRSIYLNDNLLTGGIPDSWQNMTMLYNLRIHHNRFTEIIPEEVCDLTDFSQLIELKAQCHICTCGEICENCVE
mmetsp:Transcript_41785/g.97847  ORF Transcript_41785/g.97847 Transcript_41785/m.97847 type:complete len:98 (+) Transcript_41785:729-1022(+)